MHACAVRVDGAEREVLRGDAAVGERVVQRGFADVRHPDEADLCGWRRIGGLEEEGGSATRSTRSTIERRLFLSSIAADDRSSGGSDTTTRTLRLLEKRPSAHGPSVSSSTTFLGGMVCVEEGRGWGRRARAAFLTAAAAAARDWSAGRLAPEKARGGRVRPGARPLEHEEKRPRRVVPSRHSPRARRRARPLPPLPPPLPRPRREVLAHPEIVATRRRLHRG